MIVLFIMKLRHSHQMQDDVISMKNLMEIIYLNIISLHVDILKISLI